ncbi:putative F-box protein PP2-B12 [Mangifera indica]|uniref:putative F-box protein PP2-B12 n=1 Tax=Mangifera indica TaxID=29780 RepID=UPI001CFA2D55|nr:putative F-box protein PP2-B12 [Mangifera indica]
MANHHQHQPTTDPHQRCEPESPMSLLPEDCIAAIISFTTPRDACRLSLVSSIFKSAAESDIVWECFLPHDYKSIISYSSSPPYLLSLPSKKELFLSLCDHMIMIDDGQTVFYMRKQSGKKYYVPRFFHSRHHPIWLMERD